MSITDLIGTALPIIQAPMAGVQGSELAIAVSEAGGLGSLPSAMLSPAALREALVSIRAGTDKPFNVNFFCHQPPVTDNEKMTAWLEHLSPYYESFGLQANTQNAGASRAPYNEAAVELIEEFKPAVVSFHFGLPAPALLERTKATGARILSSATTVEEAVWLEAHGADAIIAQGLEAGGHRGHFLSDDLTLQAGTFALLPRILQQVQVPVVAAGGIASAAGLEAALLLGAAGVQIGTAYLLCSETRTSSVHRTALASDAAEHTALTNIFSGRPARGIVNRAIRELGPMNAMVPEFPLGGTALGPLRAHAEAKGSGDFSPLWAGQNVSGCEAISAAELTRKLAERINPRYSS